MRNYTQSLLVLCLISISLCGWGQVDGFRSSEREYSTTPSADQPAFTTAESPSDLTSLQIVLDTIFYEDFSSGFENWTVTPTIPVDTALWVVGSDSLGGRFSSGPFESTTANNGYAVLNYDLYNTNGDSLAGVIRPVDPVMQDLISPSFSTARNTGERLGLLFYQNYRFCCDDDANGAVISFSLDGGRTFGGDTLINANLPANERLTEYSLLEIPQAYVGQEDVQVRFSFNGTFYLWAIDDISVVVYPDVQLQVDDFYARAPNSLTPSAQADSLFFLTDVTNDGQVNQDVKLALTIERVVSDSTFELVYTDTLNYETIDAQTLIQNRNFAQGYPMPTEVGEYLGTYSIVSPNLSDDPLENNNTRTFPFGVSESTFTKTRGRTTNIRPLAGEQEFEIGNIYLTPSLTAGDTVQIDSVFFGGLARGFEDNGETQFGILTVTVYGFKGDLNRDTIPNFETRGNDEAELVELGFNEIDVDVNFVSDSLYDVPVLNDDNGAIAITADDGYIGFATSVRYTEASGANENDEFYVAANELVNYIATDLATDQLGQGNRRITNFAVVENNPSFPRYLTYGTATLIGARVRTKGGVVSTNELSGADFNVSPNPANTSFVVTYSEGLNDSGVKLEIRNALGQLVKGFTRDALRAGQLTVSTVELNNGLYYVNIKTADGQIGSRKLYINK